jgi:hypothetical protein
MHFLQLGQRLTVAVVISLMLLITSCIGLGVAIRNGVVLPPTGELRYGVMHIVAYSTQYAECSPTTLCPPQSVAPAQSFYVVWNIRELPTVYMPYSRTARRLLAIPVKR